MPVRYKSILTLITTLLVVSAVSSPAFAQEDVPIHAYLSSKFFASVGLFRPDQKMTLGLDGTVETPDPEPSTTGQIDFAETFGFTNSDETGSVEFGWRFGEKWMLRGQYFRVEAKSRATLEEDVEWGGVVFNQGTSISAGTDFQITRLFFGYRFKSAPNLEFGAGLGIHMLDISAFINGNATIDGVDVGFRQERASISQPLPNIGAWYVHAFSPKWVATARLDWLQAKVGDYDGGIVNAAVSVGYAFNDHFGIGLAYNYFEIDVKVSDPDWDGRINSRFNGPFLSLTGYW
jgi:hypothetical protein